MASAFDISVDWLLRPEIEGKFCDSPNDRGGRTKWGISQRSYPKLNIAALTRDEAKEIYRRDFWDAPNLILGKIAPLPLQMVLLGGAVNHGQTAMARLFQAELNRLGGAKKIKVDGHVGPQTRGKLYAITQYDRDRELDVAQAVLWARLKLYRAIVDKRPADLPNLRHWCTRLALLGETLIQAHLDRT
ncbi:MAG: hypothetical protein K9K66_04495 [Desulfarculaceae bacterium]|nr:hypothetical protein [Desulfarculaceae bacterium]MCF8073303.1 hypothetical protein [Desulfarculaceae bacterium]MCF8100899.1 hypothetical protein [Desulfarculaceae bacterium]MCF8116645.1 hypothetical protein [Desulfarculaceae bacterium]